MTQKQFDKLLRTLNNYAEEIRLAKRPEYTNENEDVLTNFKTTADRLNVSEMKVWATFFDKQIQSVFAHVKNANLQESEPIHSRFADIINYCYLGYALFRERNDDTKKIKKNLL